MEHLQRTWKHHPLEHCPFLCSPGHWCDWSNSLLNSSHQWTHWLCVWHMYEEKKGWYAVKDNRELYILTTSLMVMVLNQRKMHKPWLNTSGKQRQFRCICTLSMCKKNHFNVDWDNSALRYFRIAEKCDTSHIQLHICFPAQEDFWIKCNGPPKMCKWEI